MGRSPCCDENGLKKGPWTPEEDQTLVDYIRKHGHGSWRALPKLAGLNRCGKSCRLRWTNYLRPDIKRGKFSAEEEQAILNLHSILGNKWSAIATHLPGRTDNEIKNFWNTHLKKKLIQMGFDPMTHRPRTDFFAALPGLLALANLQELVDQRPWEAAEAVQTAKLHYLQYLLQSSSGSSVPQQNPNPNISIDQSTSTLTGINIDQSFNSLQPYGVDTTGLMNQPLAPCSFGQIGESNFVSDELQLIPSCYEQQQQQQQQQQQPLMESLPPLADFSGPAGNLSGDACSSSSCGVSSNGMPSSFWPEVLLDDPFMNEFA